MPTRQSATDRRTHALTHPITHERVHYYIASNAVPDATLTSRHVFKNNNSIVMKGCFFLNDYPETLFRFSSHTYIEQRVHVKYKKNTQLLYVFQRKMTKKGKSTLKLLVHVIYVKFST